MNFRLGSIGPHKNFKAWTKSFKKNIKRKMMRRLEEKYKIGRMHYK